MMEYEKIFSENLHAALKDRVIGGINVCVNYHDRLCVKIIREKDLNYTFTYEQDESFSNKIRYGYSAMEACNDVIKAYRNWIMNMCFKH